MNTLRLRLSVALTALAGMLCCAGQACATVSFDWATVGNAGNAPYMFAGIFPLGGDVAYEYRMAKTEVTIAQYAQFLNAVDPNGANTLGLYDTNMMDLLEFNSIDDFGGLNFIAANPAGSKYQPLAGRENRPITYVNWYDAARFVNWMHNGQPSGGGTETGAYTLLGGTPTPSNGASITRNPDAKYFLPTYDEWVKAGYHDASAGVAGDYFLYPNASDVRPFSTKPTTDPSGANYFHNDGDDANGIDDGYVNAGDPGLAGKDVFTDVGAYFDAVSAYGTYDQGGNAKEWLETYNASAGSRGVMGAGWSSTYTSMQYTGQSGGGNLPDTGAIDTAHIGLRLAAPLSQPLTGDLNGDGFVGLTDLDIVLGNWNQNVTPGDHGSGDPSGDGFVGLADLDTVLGNWNAGTPPGYANRAAPEPGMVAIFGLGMSAVLTRRRQTTAR